VPQLARFVAVVSLAIAIAPAPGAASPPSTPRRAERTFVEAAAALPQGGPEIGASAADAPEEGWVGRHVPAALAGGRFLEVQAWQWTGLLVTAVLALVIALLVGSLAQLLATRLVRATRATWDNRLVEKASGPARLVIGLSVFAALERALRLAPPAEAVVAHVLRTGAVVAFGWAALRAVAFAAEVASERVAGATPDAATRSRITQVMVMKRIAGFVVLLVSTAVALVQFDALRALGTSLLASAGVAGIVVLGTVLLPADHRVPVAAVRAELERFVRTRSEWNGEVVGLQVTDASERGIQLRALVSADDAGRSWDLRCAVREHLVAHLQALDGGRYLPRTRFEPVSTRNAALAPVLTREGPRDPVS
jgi:low affinity Fe/Cu permease